MEHLFWFLTFKKLSWTIQYISALYDKWKVYLLRYDVILYFQVDNDGYTDQGARYPLLKQSSLDPFKIEPDGLKKFDSFSRWMSNELPEVADLDIKSSSDAFWSTTETVNVADGSSIPINEQLDAFVVSPSLSQDQLFSIIDVSPSWAYNGTKTKVCILYHLLLVLL